MTADQTRILAELSELLRSVTDSLLPGEELTSGTLLVEELGLNSLQIANMTGRVQARYGFEANLVPFFAAREAGPFTGLRAGEVAEYLAGVLNGDVTPAVPGAAAAPAEMVHGVPAPPDPCGVIIGSGRCGSTMLSRLIAQEPETLSASESLGHIRSRILRQPVTPVTGAQYWAMQSEPGSGRILLRLGIVPAQFGYPDGGRYAGDKTKIPPILLITLPAISADPDRLFDQLAERVPRFPVQTIGQHHKMLLDLLADLTGRRRWVERSGGSSFIADPVLAAFTGARVVYLTRNVADTARSMSKHPAFQMWAARHWFHARYGVDPYLPRSVAGTGRTPVPSPDELPPAMRRLLPDRLTREALQEMGQDMALFEGLAEHMHGVAEQALADRKPAHLHRVRYEDLVTSPREELAKLGEFLGFADPGGWAARTAGQVKPARAPVHASM